MLDIRYIYICKAKAGRRLTKIGIAKDVKSRVAAINRSIKGKRVQAIAYFKVLNASRLESFLHRRFSKKRVLFRGSGKTEWFALSFPERILLYAIIAIHGVAFAIALLFLLGCILITSIVLLT